MTFFRIIEEITFGPIHKVHVAEYRMTVDGGMFSRIQELSLVLIKSGNGYDYPASVVRN